jgi:hypothetical protein
MKIRLGSINPRRYFNGQISTDIRLGGQTPGENLGFDGTPSALSENMYPAETISVIDYSSGGTKPISTTFAWTSGGVSVGSNVPYYTLQASDIGNAIQCVVEISDGSGLISATVAFGSCVAIPNNYDSYLISDAVTAEISLDTSGFDSFSWAGSTPANTQIDDLSLEKLTSSNGVVAFATDTDWNDSSPAATHLGCWHGPSKSWIVAPYDGLSGGIAGRPSFSMVHANAEVRSGDSIPSPMNDSTGWVFLFLSNYVSGSIDTWPDYGAETAGQNAGGMRTWTAIPQPADIGSDARSTLEPVAWFVDPPYEHATTLSLIGVVADHYNGIDRVEFFTSENRSIPYVVSTSSDSRGWEEYQFPLSLIDVGDQRVVEVRAVVYPSQSGRPRVIQGTITSDRINETDRQYTEQMRGKFSLYRIRNSSTTTYTVGTSGSHSSFRDALETIGSMSGDFSRREIVFADNENHDLLNGSAPSFIANPHNPVILRGNETTTTSGNYQTAVLRQSGYLKGGSAGEFRFANAIFSLEDLQLRAGEIQFYNIDNQMMIVNRCLLDSQTSVMTEYQGTTLDPAQDESSQKIPDGGIVYTNPALSAGRPTAILTSTSWSGRESFFYNSTITGGGLGVAIPVVVNCRSVSGTLDASHAPCTVNLTVENLSREIDRPYQSTPGMTIFIPGTTYSLGDFVLVYYNSAWRVYEAAVDNPDTGAFETGTGDIFPKVGGVVQWTDSSKHVDGWQGETFGEFTYIDNVLVSDYVFDGTSIGQPWFWRVTGEITGMAWRNWTITMSDIDANLNTRAPFAPPNHWIVRNVVWASGTLDRIRFDMSDLAGGVQADRGWATARDLTGTFDDPRRTAKNIKFINSSFVNGIYVYDEGDVLGTGTLNLPYGSGTAGFDAFANPSGSPAGWDIVLDGTSKPELNTGS